MKPYERLRAWELSHRLVLEVYRATESWPKREMYGLSSQARRAAFSIPASIAEGVAKRGQREFRRYLDIALGSSSELCYILRVARDLGYLPERQWERIETQRDAAGKTLWRLYESVARRSAS
jgi:four helix bundle protein